MQFLAKRWLLVILFIINLGGCANLSPVRSFAEETKKFSTAFKPILAGSTSSCTEKYLWKKMITSSDFDPGAEEANANTLCGPIESDSQVIADLNNLIQQYADTLIALADDKLVSYKTELDGLAASLAKVKKPGTQEALVEPGKLSAITSLTEFLSRTATRHHQKKAIRDLLNHDEAVNSVVQAMSDYATLNYAAWLTDRTRENAILYKALDGQMDKEPLAVNYLKSHLAAEGKKINAQTETVKMFATAATELQKTNAQLNASFDRTSDKEFLDQLIHFSQEVANLRQQVSDAF
jgi:hypothetical protein